MNDKIASNTAEQLKTVVQDLLAYSNKLGITSIEVGASMDSGLSTSVRLGEVETIEFSRDRLVGITVYKGKRKGSVSTTDISPEAIASALQAACDVAEYTQEDEHAGLADSEFLAQQIPDLDLYHPADFDPNQAVEISKTCEKFALAYDPRITNSEGANFSSLERFKVYGNSNGFLGFYPSTRYTLSCVVIGQEHDSMQRDYDFTVARSINDLDAYQAVGESAAKRALARLGARKISTCKAPVIFSPQIATSLISSLIAAISGGNLYRKASFLLDSLHKPVLPSFIGLAEHPLKPMGLYSRPFDNEGVATQNRNIVENGVLQSYVLSSYSARRLGLTTTGNAGGAHNISLQGKGYDLSELIKQMGTGLIVTELMGHGVNLVTGDYSRGASGFWVEQGEIQYPVEEITIAGNLRDMLMNIVAIGNDIDKRSNITTGSILLEKMTIAGN